MTPFSTALIAFGAGLVSTVVFLVLAVSHFDLAQSTSSSWDAFFGLAVISDLFTLVAGVAAVVLGASAFFRASRGRDAERATDAS